MQSLDTFSIDTILDDDGTFLMQSVQKAAESCFNMAASISKREEIPKIVIDETVKRIPSLLEKSQTLRQQLRKVDDAIRKQKNQSRVLKDLIQINRELEAQESRGNEPRVKDLNRRKRELAPNVKNDLMQMAGDIKQSLRYRYQILNSWRQMVSMDVDLNSAYLNNLVIILLGYAENTADEELKQIIQNRIQQIPKIEIAGIRETSPPDDPEELQNLIYMELTDLEKIETKRMKLIDQTVAMETMENFLVEEAEGQGFPSVTPKSFRGDDETSIRTILKDIDLVKVIKQYKEPLIPEERKKSEIRIVQQKKT